MNQVYEIILKLIVNYASVSDVSRNITPTNIVNILLKELMEQ